jgi:flagellar hook-length control protein FliK
MSVPGEPAPNANPVAQFPHPSLVARRESMPLGAAASSEVLAQANQFDAKAESTAQLAQPSIADAARSEVRSRAFDQVAVQNSVLPEPAGSAVEVGQAQVRGALLNATPAQAAQGAAVAQTVPQPSAEAQIEMALDNPAPVRVDVASDGNRRQPPAAHSRSTLLDPASTSGAADAAGEWASEWLRAAGTDEAPGLQAASTLGRTVGSPQWAEALAGRVQWQAGQGIQRAEIRLDPPELGALEVQIDLSEDGAQIRFGTEHAAAREALDAALPRLRELLSQSGFGEVQVDVGDRQQQSFAETAADSGQSGDEQAGGRGESSAEAANSLSAVANGVPGNRPHGGLTASGGFDAFA